jgi:hypothetical protein
MSTLNGGFSLTRDNPISDEDKGLIEDYIRENGITKVHPAGVDGAEISRSTRERISLARKEFRKARKDKS